MNIKNIILATMSLFLLVPANASALTIESPKNDEGEYDYRNGLLDDDYIIDKENTDIPKKWYDNDESSSGYNDDTEKTITFKHPINIDSIYWVINSNKTSSHKIKLEFFDGSSEEINNNYLKDQENKNDYYKVNFKDVIKIKVTGYSTSMNRPHIRELDFFGSYNKESKIEGQANIKGGDLELINESEPNEPIEIKVGERDNINLNPIELKVQDNRLETDSEWNLKMSGDIESEDNNGNLSIEDVVFSNLEQGNTNGGELEIDENEFNLEEDSSKTITSSDAYEYDVNIKDVEINVPRDIKSNSYTANINFELDNGPSEE